MYLVTDLKEMTCITMYVTLLTLTRSKGTVLLRALREAWQPSNPSAPSSQWVLQIQMQRLLSWMQMIKLVVELLHYLIEDGSYFRLKKYQLTYTFGDAIKDALGISGGQVYLQGQNLAYNH